MTREEKAKKKEYTELIKKLGKKFGMKHKQCVLFYTFKDYFIDIIYRFGVKSNTFMYRAGIKYMDYDDIQWDVLDMSDNKKQPLSLRAVGAFSAGGIQFIENTVVSLGNEPEVVVDNILAEIKQKTEAYNEDIDSKILDMIGEKDEDKMEAVTKLFIVYIHIEKYSEARELIEKCLENGYEGSYGNKGKMFVELALEYLDKNNL